jgi:hypothetical protein
MPPIVWRDPAIFMQAVAMVCQIETIGGHPTMVFAKGKERETRTRTRTKKRVREGKNTG